MLAVFVLAALAPGFALAADSDILMLKDFGNPAELDSVIRNHGTAEVSAFAYEGKTTSVKYVMSYDANETLDVVLNTEDNDLSAYNVEGATINIRYYTEAVGSRVNLLYYKTDDFSGNYYPVPDDKTATNYTPTRPTMTKGWQTFTVPFANVYEKTGNTITFRLSDDAWNNASRGNYNEGDTIYLDSIWIDKAPVVDDPMYADTSLIVYNPDNGDSSISTTGRDIKCDPERNVYTWFSTTKVLNVMKRDMTGNKTSGYVYNSIFDATGYDYVNMWLYSPKAQDSGFDIRIYSSKGGSGYSTTLDGVASTTEKVAVACQIPQVNWEGWKLVSFAIPEGTSKIYTIELLVAQSGVTGANWPENSIPVEFGVDGIWLSKGETSPAAAYEAAEAIGTIAARPAVSGDIILGEYNTPEAVNTATGVNVSVTNDNSHLYDMAARLSWKTFPNSWAKTNITTDFMSKLDVYGKDGSDEYTITPAELGENPYLNMWIYNPEVKYTSSVGADYAELLLVPCYYNAKTVRKPVCVMADWTGWKLVSIPLKDITTDFLTYGVSYVYVGANTGWYATSSSYQVTRTDAQVAQGWAVCTGTHNSFTSNSTANLNNDRVNYMDIERVWISDGPVSDTVSVTDIDNSALICPENGSDVYLYSPDSEILDTDIKVVKLSDTVDEVVEDAAFDNGTLTLNNGLGYGEDYAVYAQIYGNNGIKLDKDYCFETENYHIMSYEKNNKINVDMHGNLPEDYANGIMIAATYDKATKRLISANPVAVEENSVTAGVASYDSETQDIKYIFISGWDDLKALEYGEDIQK